MTSTTSVPPLVIVCGPIAKEGAPAGGGYQRGNRRAIIILRQLGYEVRELAYPEDIPTIWGKLKSYALAFSHIGLSLLKAPKRPASMHMTPLVRHFIAVELLLCAIAKMRGIKLAIDLRAGVIVSEYNARSFLYRMMFRKLIRMADAVSFEAEEYGDFVRSISPQTPRTYLPNFIDATEISLPPRLRDAAHPKLIYVGRVSEAKGALHAARMMKDLQLLLPDSSLTYVGGIDDDIEAQIVAIGAKNIAFAGAQPSDAVRAALDESHYFVFLSKWWGEGHSNALTEAMGRGCVPVYTVHAFNEAVAGDTGLRIENRDDAAGVAGRIAAHWSSGAWPQASVRASTRVSEKFNDVVARNALRQIHGPFFNAANSPANVVGNFAD